MKRLDLRLVLLAALALGAGGCDTWYYKVPSPDDLWRIIPWFDHMVDARYVRPYETDSVARYTPPGTVPVTGGELDWSAEWMAGKTTTADALVNPFTTGGYPGWGGRPGRPMAGETPAPPETGPASAQRAAAQPGPEVAKIPREVAATGDTLYQTFCAVCHGAAGDGRGPVQVGAPPLISGRARGYSDGYLYGIIRYGRGVMPRYGDKVYNPADRWAIVTHLRQLQAQTPAPAEPPGAATPIPPAPSATGSTGAYPR